MTEYAFHCYSLKLKDNSRADLINATKETYDLLPQILTFVSHFGHSNGCQFQKRFDNLGHILSLCHHFPASAHDKEASNN